MEALRDAIRAIAPDLVVAGGDLTQRARTEQFREARAFLDDLGAPWMAIPGNHDVPLWNLLLRVFDPLGRYRRHITGERAPLAAIDGMRVLGLDSTRRKVVGRLKPARIRHIARLADGDPGALRVLVTHHPLVRKPLLGARAALAAARRAGVDVVLAGHHHQSHVFDSDPVAVETPSPSHLLEPVKGFAVVRARAGELAVESWLLGEGGFAPGRPRTFPRRNDRVTRR